MGNIGEALKKSINRLGITRQVEAAGVVEAAQKEIAKYIPEEDFEVVSFKDKVIKVSAASSVVANEIKLNESRILAALMIDAKLKIIAR